jgi:guanylate kinase
VHGNFYGTSKRLIEEHTRAGRDVLLEIDWQGAQQVRRQFPDAVGIFILPPSVAVLEQRLKQRAQDSDEVIARRVQNAAGEIAHADEFDYVIINENFDVALTQLVDIARASRCRFGQQAARFSDLFAGFGIQT